MPELPLPLSSISTLAAPLDHPEAVALAPDGSLWAGGEAGQLYRIDPSGSFAQVADTRSGMLLGLAFDAAGRTYACAPEVHAVLRYDLARDALETYVAATSAAPLRLPNFCAFAADGSLFLSDSGSEARAARDGTIVRVSPGGDAETLEIAPLHFPNGIALAADGRLAILESYTPRLSLLDLQRGALEVAAELPGTVPDGVAFDAEGGALVSCYQPNRILRVAPDRSVATVMEDWMGIELLSPTNVAFYGAGGRQLAIASLCGTSVSAIEVPWAGQPVPCPAVA